VEAGESSVQTAHPVTLTGGGSNDTLQTNNGAHTFNFTGHNAGNFSVITDPGAEGLREWAAARLDAPSVPVEFAVIDRWPDEPATKSIFISRTWSSKPFGKLSLQHAARSETGLSTASTSSGDVVTCS
jgi:hypothetical protein